MSKLSFHSCDLVAISISNANSSASLHQALVGHFDGRLGQVLLRKHKCELRFAEQEFHGFRRLPGNWKGLLKPGDRISMNALVERPKDETVIVCPACSTWIANRMTTGEEITSWMKCPYCSTTVRLSNSIVKDDEDGLKYHNKRRDNQRPPLELGLPGNGYNEGSFNEEAALRRCTRVHILESAPQRPFRDKYRLANVKRTRGESTSINLDTECGVINDKNLRCRRHIVCKTHSMGAKRAVQDGSKPFDEVLLEFNRRHDPYFVEPSVKETKAEEQASMWRKSQRRLALESCRNYRRF